MHLKKIKLAGFKSFVDPTTIHFRSKIAAILGPNGCGKSNVIDAVRWVMGESSAKQLRGTAMADVIFNGSAQRKPLGQASIELTFDNSDAGIGGEYAQYGEIAVRREIGRDGVSDYYLNGTRCRRRDIIDIFLGTGLGSNSYAIIEQGTISQFVEAKPEELRLYLEEAAGTSKYKERRRETENRIRHTRENLARLNDIRLELEQQLKHLQTQANTAERYKKLKQEERQTKAELCALNWQHLHNNLRRIEELIGTEATALEDKNIEQQSYETKINLERERHQDLLTAFNTTQENFYRIDANIARIEQQLQHAKEHQQHLTGELAKLERSLEETTQHENQDRAQLNLLQNELNNLGDAQPDTANKLHHAEQELHNAENEMRKHLQAWESFSGEMARCERNCDVTHTKMQHAAQTIINEEQRLQKMREELASFTANSSNKTEIQSLEETQDELQNQSDDLHENLVAKQREISEQRAKYEQLKAVLNDARHQQQILAGKRASLESLQEAALGKNDAIQKKWLQEKNLGNKPRLLQKLKVATGWEKAMETVLAGYLEALCVEDIAVAQSWQDLPAAHLALFATNNNTTATSPINTALQLPTLLSKIEEEQNHISLLAGIYTADNLATALTARNSLAKHESIVTKDGIWLGVDWLLIAGTSEAQNGIIQRERELKELTAHLQEREDLVLEQEDNLAKQQAIITAVEQQYHEIQHKLRAVTATLGKIQGEISAKQKHATYLEQRHNSLRQDILNHENIVAVTRTQHGAIEKAWQEEQAQQKQLATQRVKLLELREQLQITLEATRTRTLELRKAVDAHAMRRELLQTQLKYLQNNLERAAKKQRELEDERLKLQEEINAQIAPTTLKEQELQHQLNLRFAAEKELQNAKQQVSASEHTLSELEEKRGTLQNDEQLLREKLEKLRLEAQEFKTKKEGYSTQVTELNYALENLLAELARAESTATVTPEILFAWEEKIAKLVARIERIGAVNLAAIDELTKQNERKEYLDTQNQDLVDALTTLETAIKKIDHETKEKFNLAFEDVNARFQALFPNIFGGGKAYLELFGDDLLEAGVAIFAQPPGKRNSSIHLLSGGEKALTAIALIFAIFQRNPAPFCILDEVDAPLDDTNVARFCNLVKEIAANVQLIFISHNKLTLEIADQLTGVTMQEPGVSRVVDVDVQQALALVEKR